MRGLSEITATLVVVISGNEVTAPSKMTPIVACPMPLRCDIVSA